MHSTLRTKNGYSRKGKVKDETLRIFQSGIIRISDREHAVIYLRVK